MSTAADVELRQEVRSELERLLGRPIASDEQECVNEVLGAVAHFDVEPADGAKVERVSIDKGPTWVPLSGRSVKPGNLRLNLGKLFETVVSGAGVYFTALTNPIFAIFTGLVACRMLVRAATVNLTSDDAFVMWAAWRAEQQGEAVTAATVLAAVDAEALRVGYSSRLSMPQVVASLERLERIGAVVANRDTWQTRESVVVHC